MVKPSPFDYVKPASLDEALSLLGKSDGEVAILAGGQSLMPTLNMRLSSPSLLIDINGIQEYTLSIYDRLGNRIFETNDYISQDCARGCTEDEIKDAIDNCIEGCGAAWDGKINNEFVPSGNFVYSIVLIDIKGKKRNFNGSLTLIR